MSVYIPTTTTSDVTIQYLQENYATRSYVTNIVGTSASPAFVALLGDQTVGGEKTFQDNINVGGDLDVTGSLSAGSITGGLNVSSLTTSSLTVNSSSPMVIHSGSDLMTVQVGTGLGAINATYNIPRQSGSSDFVLTEGAQTINGIKALAGTVNFTGTTNLTESNKTTLKPSFVSQTNFNLQESSLMINAGIDVGLPYNSTAPDLGAFEHI